MERWAVEQPSEAARVGTRMLGYVGWKEELVSNDKGRREVHYRLKRKDGGSDLVVVGKEKSLRHMSYSYAIQSQALLESLPSSLLVKLRSRREVIDWLASIVPESIVSCWTGDDLSGGKDPSQLDVEELKDALPQKLNCYPDGFLWLGSSWTCKKKRVHYQSCYRAGVQISVNNFVYVLAEENNPLVAYLYDMYEDSRGNNMVAVQWFHKIDEVGMDLPHKFNGREIFFSHCLQDLSIECIDGLACVLSPQHFDTFRSQAKQSRLHPFFCHRQYDNDELKSFDISQLKGYWNQEILRCMYSPPSLDDSHLLDGCLKLEDPNSCGVVSTSRKRIRLSRGFREVQIVLGTDPVSCGSGGQIRDSRKSGFDSCFASNGVGIERPTSPLAVGQQVEVLSQDSGLRGCWFRAFVIKRHKDKVKVRYEDLKDADDEANGLEEWILASRIAAQDNFGLRLNGRTTIRPAFSDKGKASWAIDVGAIVDAWWHDGWWEGIVIHKQSMEKVMVYFPGEKRNVIFGCDELRHSQEWLGGVWSGFEGRPDIASSISSELEMKRGGGEACNVNSTKSARSSICSNKKTLVVVLSSKGGPLAYKGDAYGRNTHVILGNDKTDQLAVPDLLKDESLRQLRWMSSRKRTRVVSGLQRSQYNGDSNGSPLRCGPCDSSGNVTVQLKESRPHLEDKFNSFKVERENCKYIGDTHFSSSVVPCATSLVMSR